MTAGKFSLTAILLSVLLSSIVGCVSTNKNQPKSDAEILETQKSVVMGYLDNADPKRAHAELRALLQKHPKDADLHNLMGLTQLAVGNKERAVANFRTAYKLSASPASALNLSSALIDTGHVKEAEKVLNQLKVKGLENYPYPERLEHNLGYAAELRKDTKKAESHYVNALQENPGFYLSLIRLAGIYERSGRKQQAYAKYDLAKTTCGICYDPVKALVRMHLADNQPEKATSLLNDYIKHEKVSAQERGQALQSLNKLGRGKNKDIIDQKVR